VSYAIQVGGIDEMVLQHLDTLSGLDELKICTSYIYKGQKLDFFPAEASVLEKVECEYESMKGFNENLRAVKDFAKLPVAAKKYVERLENILGIPISMVGVGPGRDETLLR